MASPLVLETHNLKMSTPEGRPLVKDLGFSLNQGELLLLTGPNGIGKSTLLKVLLGQSKPVNGSVHWHVPKKNIGYLSQLHNREFHIGLNLADVLRFSGECSPENIAERSRGLLSARHLHLAWNTASGGERQKTLLTRMFLENPQVLILDEPMNHLDFKSRQQLREALLQFVSEQSRSVLMVGHPSSLDLKNWSNSRMLDLKGYRARE